MGALLRPLLISLAIVAGGVGVIFATLNNAGETIRFFDLQVLNDTQRSVTITSCWDLNCYDTRGFHAAVVRPGGSVHEAGHFATDTGQEIAVGVGKPGVTTLRFSSCLFTHIAPGQATGLVRVSHAQHCLTGQEGGGPGGG